MRTWFIALAVLVMAASTHAQELLVLPKQDGWVGAVAFAPDSRTLAIGTGAGSVMLWDATTGKKLTALKGHKDAVATLVWSAGGEMLASGAHDHTIGLHTVDGERGRNASVISPSAHRGAVMSAAFAPNPKRLFTGGMDATIREWDFTSQKTAGVERGHTSWVNGLAVDRNGTLLASGSSDNSIIVRKLPELDIYRRWRVDDGEVRSVAFSPDGRLLAAGIRYGTVRIWLVHNKKEPAVLKAHAGETWAVAFTPDGKTLATGGGDWNQPGEVKLWDLATNKVRKTHQHSGEVLCLSISPDGRLLAAGSWDRTVRIWKLAYAR